MNPAGAPAVAHLASPRRGPAFRALRIIHPFPTLLNVAASAGLAFVAAAGTPDAAVLARMLVSMFLVQSAIGVTNDLFDRELDAKAKPWKPLPSGAMRPATAAWLSAACVGGAVFLGLTLGLASLALLMLGLACGLAYDARLKRSPLSAVPFMVAIPTLPIWVWVTLGEWELALWWLLPLGGLLGLSLHLANTLPDIDQDAAHGVRGLAHRLGEARSAALGWSAFALALALSLALAPALDYDLALYAPAAAFGCLCLASAAGLFLLRRDTFALQAGFSVIGIASAVMAVGWLAAVT